MNQLNVPAEMLPILQKLYLSELVGIDVDTAVSEAQALLIALIEQLGKEIIGEDQAVQYLNEGQVVITNPEVTAYTNNKFRAAQRQRLAELLDKGAKR